MRMHAHGSMLGLNGEIKHITNKYVLRLMHLLSMFQERRDIAHLKYQSSLNSGNHLGSNTVDPSDCVGNRTRTNTYQPTSPCEHGCACPQTTTNRSFTLVVRLCPKRSKPKWTAAQPRALHGGARNNCFSNMGCGARNAEPRGMSAPAHNCCNDNRTHGRPAAAEACRA